MGPKPILNEQALEKIKSLSFENLINYQIICKEFNVSHKTAQRAMRKLGIKHASQKTINILKEYIINRKTSTEIATLFGVTRDDINKIVKLYGFTRKYRLDLIGGWKTKCNYRYFQNINTPAKAYFLGFIYADGCVTNTSLQIGINRRDKEILIKLKKYMNANFNYKTYKYKTSYGDTESVNITIKNKDLFNDLVSHGAVPRKTLILKYPIHIPKELYRHFIRGYNDGDGCISNSFRVSSYMKKDGTKSIAFRTRVLIQGTFNLLNEIGKIIKEELSIILSPKAIIQRGNIYQLTISNSYDVLKFLNWIYKDSTVHLSRKFEKYAEVLQNVSAVYKSGELSETPEEDNTEPSLLNDK